MRRWLLSLSAVALVTGFIATPVASAQQSLSLYVGGFTCAPKMPATLTTCSFRTNRFSTSTSATSTQRQSAASGLSASATCSMRGSVLGFYQDTVTAIDSFSEFEGTGAPIRADLKLRIVPFTATIRFLPLGHRAAIQPYVGGRRRRVRMAI